MTDTFDAIFVYLSGKTALTALLGTPLRLFPESVPQNCQRPFVAYTCHDIERTVHLKGASAIADCFVSFDIYADDVSDRYGIANALRNILHSRQNTLLTDSTGATIRMEWCELQRDVSTNKPPPDGTEEVVFCRSLSFRMVVDEAVPTLP